MPAFERRDLYQRALYWPKIGQDKFNEPIHGEPDDIFIRWNQVRTEITDSKGDTVTLDGTVIAAQELVIDSLMWLAPDFLQPALDQWYANGSAGFDNELMQVKANTSDMRDLKGRNRNLTYGLMRFRRQLDPG